MGKGIFGLAKASFALHCTALERKREKKEDILDLRAITRKVTSEDFFATVIDAA